MVSDATGMPVALTQDQVDALVRGTPDQARIEDLLAATDAPPSPVHENLGRAPVAISPAEMSAIRRSGGSEGGVQQRMEEPVAAEVPADRAAEKAAPTVVPPHVAPGSDPAA